ncbi:hypothetical protein HY345_02900 [Candidatus Microgenomates bacterium]|nr:hypothetical protein [Candidatus Microgenomates bacterium]
MKKILTLIALVPLSLSFASYSFAQDMMAQTKKLEGNAYLLTTLIALALILSLFALLILLRRKRGKKV